MKAWRIAETAGALTLENLADPLPAEGEARVRVMAVGLNFADLLMRDGKYQVRPDFPYTPGMEMAGVVEALGPGTTGPAPGTRVLA